MEFGFAIWLAIVVVGSLLWSALSWNLLQRRIKRNRDGKCANCSATLDDSRTRIGGLLLCAACARRSRLVVTVAVRAIAIIVIGGSAAMFWAVHRVWQTNREGAWLMVGLWGLYAGVLVFLALLSARDAREAVRRVARIERLERSRQELADTGGGPRP
jgi:hypothetical protein